MTKIYFSSLQGLKARGNVEDWLGKVEEAMFVNLRKLVKFALTDYEQRPRSEWVVTHASQIVLTVSQIIWCRSVTEILEGNLDRLEGMRNFEQQNFKVRYSFTRQVQWTESMDKINSESLIFIYLNN